MKKNGILTLLFACIPGAGQMYQGYMKRGLSLITMFCLFIILGILLPHKVGEKHGCSITCETSPGTGNVTINYAASAAGASSTRAP